MHTRSKIKPQFVFHNRIIIRKELNILEYKFKTFFKKPMLTHTYQNKYNLESSNKFLKFSFRKQHTDIKIVIQCLFQNGTYCAMQNRWKGAIAIRISYKKIDLFHKIETRKIAEVASQNTGQSSQLSLVHGKKLHLENM